MKTRRKKNKRHRLSIKAKEEKTQKNSPYPSNVHPEKKTLYIRTERNPPAPRAAQKTPKEADGEGETTILGVQLGDRTPFPPVEMRAHVPLPVRRQSGTPGKSAPPPALLAASRRGEGERGRVFRSKFRLPFCEEKKKHPRNYLSPRTQRLFRLPPPSSSFFLAWEVAAPSSFPPSPFPLPPLPQNLLLARLPPRLTGREGESGRGGRGGRTGGKAKGDRPHPAYSLGLGGRWSKKGLSFSLQN